MSNGDKPLARSSSTELLGFDVIQDKDVTKAESEWIVMLSQA